MITSEILSLVFDSQKLIALMADNWLYGVALVALIVFAETGLVVLPFLPGDSLLFATGTCLGLVGVSPLPGWLLILLAAIAGDFTNYAIGRSAAGQSLLRRGWVKPKHIERTRHYFDRFGPSTITVGRFIPIVRTIAPFLAGLTGMDGRRFAFYNVLGGLIWTSLLVLGGYWLGRIEWVRQHMQWIMLGIVLASLAPVAVQLARQGSLRASRREKRQE
ncbi:DedA family protein [Achromobacter aloeverae]